MTGPLHCSLGAAYVSAFVTEITSLVQVAIDGELGVQERTERTVHVEVQASGRLASTSTRANSSGYSERQGLTLEEARDLHEALGAILRRVSP
jgi:hypothetical protein